MAIFTTWAKINSVKYFCNTRVAGLSEIFVQRKVLAVWYVHWEVIVCCFTDVLFFFLVTACFFFFFPFIVSQEDFIAIMTGDT